MSGFRVSRVEQQVDAFADFAGGRLEACLDRALQMAGAVQAGVQRGLRGDQLMAAMGCLGGYRPKVEKCLAIPLVKLSM